MNKAIDVYRKAAESDDEMALNFLGAHEFNRSQNIDKAVDLFRKGCDSERNARALNNLGMCFQMGIGNA